MTVSGQDLAEPSDFPVLQRDKSKWENPFPDFNTRAAAVGRLGWGSAFPSKGPWENKITVSPPGVRRMLGNSERILLSRPLARRCLPAKRGAKVATPAPLDEPPRLLCGAFVRRGKGHPPLSHAAWTGPHGSGVLQMAVWREEQSIHAAF